MNDPMLVLLAILTLAAVYVLLPAFLSVYSRYRDRRKVECPRGAEDASVRVDAKLAAFTSLAGNTKLRVKDCPLWNGVRNCHQECLTQL